MQITGMNRTCLANAFVVAIIVIRAMYICFMQKTFFGQSLFSFDWFSRDRKDNVDVEDGVNETEREREKKQ